MITKLIAYNSEALERKLTIDKAQSWFKSGLLSADQYDQIKQANKHDLFAPSLIMRVLIFIASYVGFSTLATPFALAFSDLEEGGIRFFLGVIGIVMIFVIDKIFIQEKKHYKTGLTEAGIFAGFSFLYISILWFGVNNISVTPYFVLALVFSVVISVRYCNVFALLLAIGCLVAVLFTVLQAVLYILPFVLIAVFSVLFLVSTYIQKKAFSFIWEDHFVVFDVVALLLIYVGGNYLVVRELSVAMMGLELAEGQDIPFAFVFYGLTVLIPLAYLYWGIVKKSVRFIRVSLLTIALAIFTLKFYFSLGHPEISITIGGAVLIVVSIVLMRYLKNPRNGFTREQLLTNKWDNSDAAAFVVSQTLGGNAVNDQFKGDGGTFGGGGASGSY